MKSNPSTTSRETELLGARRLSFMVGREKERSEIKNLCRQLDHHTLVYWEGDGGVGKTTLLEYAIQQAKKAGDIRVVNLIDLYHIDYQTPTGLAEAIIQGLGAVAFSGYTNKVKELRAKTRSGEEVTKQWKDALKIFTDELSAFTREQKVLIALDTVEVLQYDHISDPFQQYAQQDLPLASVGRWLLEEILPHVKNESALLWLWAGRPTELGLRLGTSKRKPDFKYRTLKPLPKEDAKLYLLSVADENREQDPNGARWIQDYVETYPEGVYAGTGGRPILLAMVADILRVGGRLPSHCYTHETESTVRDDASSLEKSLVQHLFDLDTPVGKTLRMMGQLRKGANAVLLSQLLDVGQDQAQDYLEEVAKLSLVKRRPQGKRPYFLHDELYDLLERYWYQATQKQKANIEKVLAYYDEEEKHILEKLRENPILNDQWEAERRAVQVERLHYRLHHTTKTGFAEYFQRAEDALDSRDWELDMLLRAELLRTLNQLKRNRSNVPDLRQELDVLRQDAELDAAVRWAARELWLNNNTENAANLLKKVQEWRPQDTQRWDYPLRWYLELYVVIVAVKDAQYEKARKGLERIEKALTRLPEDDTLVKVLKAFTGAYQGYLDRLQGRYYQAVAHYQQATTHFRDLKMGSLISALSNQAYAMAQIGHFRRARLVLQEAYERATEESQPYWQSHVLNVRALVETMDGHSRTGLRYADDALRIFEGPAQSKRLKGLTLLTKAKALRYLWNDYVTERRWRTGIAETLWPAYNTLEGTDHGLQLLQEKAGYAYVVEGQIESGCIFRGMAWAYRRLKERPTTSLTEDQLQVFQKSDQKAERRLLEAAGIVNFDAPWESQLIEQIEKLGGDPYLPALAMVNLAWHYHYRRRTAKGEELDIITKRIISIDEYVKSIIPREYHLPEALKNPVRKEKAHILLWSILGKMEMLHVHEMLWNWKKITNGERETRLKTAVEHATYSLEYNRLMGDVSFDLRRAEEGLHYRLLQTPDWQGFVLPKLYEYGKLNRDEFTELPDGNHTTFQRWLFETFGKRL